MFSQYYSDILELLLTKEYVSRADIAAKIMVSPRKVQNIISQMNNYLSKFDTSIQSKPGKGNGYYLSVQDGQTVENVKKSLHNLSAVEMDKEYRKQYIIMALLSNEYVNLQNLSEELYISDRLIRYDLEEVREELKSYNLDILKFSNKGITLSGTEKDIRRFMAKRLSLKAKAQSANIREQEFAELKGYILSLMKEYSYPIFDFSIENLTIHLLILAERVEAGHAGMPYHLLDYNSRDAKEIADKLIAWLEKRYAITLNEYERNYVYLQILLKREYKYPPNTKVDNQICELVLNMLQEIDRQYHTKLQLDFNLCMNLSLHFIMLLKRIKYDMQLQNPLLDEIKKNYLYDFELACCGASYLNKCLSCKISEDEIGYMALYIQLSLSERESQKKSRVLIVCTSGRGISEIVKRNFEHHFKDYIEVLDVISLAELEKTEQPDYDYIFSTIPIEKNMEKPVFYINSFLMDEDIRNVRSVLGSDRNAAYFDKNLFLDHVKAKDKYEVIRQMTAYVSEYIELPETFEENVRKREQVYSTSLGNNVAFPHPQQMIESRTFVCFARLAKPVKWDKEHMVSLVIMVSIDKNDPNDMDELYDAVAKIINYPENVNSLVRDFTHDNLMRIICRD